jgi:hypothetical protein
MSLPVFEFVCCVLFLDVPMKNLVKSHANPATAQNHGALSCEYLCNFSKESQNLTYYHGQNCFKVLYTTGLMIQKKARIFGTAGSEVK